MGKRICGLVLALALAGGVLWAQYSPKVSDIKKYPGQYKDEIVTVEGFITQYVDVPNTKSTSFYILKDDYGGFIKVRTSQGKPEVGKRYRVTGPVTIDTKWNYSEPFISEEKRVLLEKPAAAPPPLVQTPTAQVREEATQAEKADNSTLYYLVGGIGFVFLLLVVVVGLIVAKSRSGAKDGILPGEMPTADLPAPAETVEGKTIKMQLPPPGTLKLLPGRFEVTAGDDTVKEIRFYKPKGRTTAEVTFGRAKGPAYSHVQLKPMTVSSRQAKVIFDAGKVVLINYASADSNPTRINGRDMGVEESVPLQPGDLIAMGEIEFRYQDN